MVIARKSIQTAWLVLTVALVIVHAIAADPFSNAADFATLLGLLALTGKATLDVWKWADLTVRKAWLWAANTSVRWTIEVRVEVSEPIEPCDVTVLTKELQRSNKQFAVRCRIGTDTISVSGPSLHRVTVRPVDLGDRACWVIATEPTFVGYRDAVAVLRHEVLPIISTVADALPNGSQRQYAIETRFSSVNPYAAVLMNELHLESVDGVLLSFRRAGAAIQISKDSIVSSTNTEVEAIGAMSTVFGLSHKGALSASHI